MSSKKKPSAAAQARAALDPDPPEPSSDIPLPDRGAIVERARPPPRLLSRHEVLARVCVSYPTIWTWMCEDKFPRAREMATGRIAWLESEIEAWIENLPVRKLKGDDEGPAQ
jgi:prophage regulatory protein